MSFSQLGVKETLSFPHIKRSGKKMAFPEPPFNFDQTFPVLVSITNMLSPSLSVRYLPSPFGASAKVMAGNKSNRNSSFMDGVYQWN